MMMTLGRKMPASQVMPHMEENKMHYPSLYITKDIAPKHEVGDSLEAKVKLKLRGVSEREDGYSCEFDVLGIDFGEKTKEKSKEDETEHEVMRQSMKKKANPDDEEEY